MTEATLTKTIFIKATPERVWTYLVDPDKLARWFHEGDAPLEAGKDFALLTEHEDRADRRLCWGKVLVSEPPKRLVYTFTHNSLKGHETEVEWRLEPAFGGTQVTLVHTGFETFDGDVLEMLTSHDKGWDDHFRRLRMVAS
ncbi:MAG: SRPBCC domain-containing protein [Hyphomonas sp.]|nr:SRPBCC domain-containing protein [Hyphomonas sp.]